MSELEFFMVLAVTSLGQVGKAGTHMVRGRDQWHRPLLAGLAITDGYHVLSGLVWLPTLALCWLVYGTGWQPWLCSLVVWALPWAAWKRITATEDDPWPVQIWKWLRRKG